MVIYVVKAAFVPLSATGEKPAIARATRLCGVSPCPVPDTATALPNRYSANKIVLVKILRMIQDIFPDTSIVPKVSHLPGKL